jgi:hypothetical protein
VVVLATRSAVAAREPRTTVHENGGRFDDGRQDRRGIGQGDRDAYVAYERIPGQIYGEGQGIFETDDGEGVIWNGMGVGTPTGQGMGMRWLAACTYQTNSKKLARLNGIVGMVEHETDARGNAKVRAWEWKAAK